MDNHPTLLRVFFWYVIVVSLFTAILQTFWPDVYVEREMRYTSSPRQQRRWRNIGWFLLIGTPVYIWLFFHFHGAAWILLSIAMTCIGAAEILLRSRERMRDSLKTQSYVFALFNAVVAAFAVFFLIHHS